MAQQKKGILYIMWYWMPDTITVPDAHLSPSTLPHATLVCRLNLVLDACLFMVLDAGYSGKQVRYV